MIYKPFDINFHFKCTCLHSFHFSETKPSGDHRGHGLGLYVCAIACQGSETILVKNAQRVKTKSRIFAINRRADRRNGKIRTSTGSKAGRGESCGKSKRESAHNFSEQADRELGKEPDGKTTKPGVAQKQSCENADLMGSETGADHQNRQVLSGRIRTADIEAAVLQVNQIVRDEAQA